MHLLVTDRLICPRCGPDFGLVLVSKRLEARRVQDGFFGCPNCREEYPVQDGFGDFRPSPRADDDRSPIDWTEDSEGSLRLAALLGVREGPGYLLLGGRAAVHAATIATMIDDIEVLANHPGLRGTGEAPGVSRLTTTSVLPFRTHSLRGIVLDGHDPGLNLREAARTLMIGGRVVLLDPPEGTAEEMPTLGFDLLLDEEGAMVGVRRQDRARSPSM